MEAGYNGVGNAHVAKDLAKRKGGSGVGGVVGTREYQYGYAETG